MRLLFKIFVAVAITFASLCAKAGVVVESSCDSVAIWIGEQTQIHISVACDAGQQISFPLFSDTIVDRLEIIPPILTDTQYIDHKKKMSVTRSYTVTAFDSAFFYIPPFEVNVDGKPYQADNGLSLVVYMFDVDTLHSDQFFGPKDIMEQPLQWQDVKSATYYLLIFAAVAVLAILLFFSWKNDKPIIRIIKVEPQKPAHEVALAEIERIRTEQLAHGEDSKRYYTELTDAIRQYMNGRFGFNATEMTSDEIISHLKEINDKDSLSELSELFSTADLVKFAKMKPLLGENDRNLLTAIEFVKGTMNTEEPEKEPEEKEIVVEQKRSKETRAILLAGVILLAAASCFTLYMLLKEIYYLFF